MDKKNIIRGLHHVTAISGAAQKNVDFYVGVLGMRFIKRTVNFDDPGTYHLYYGDAVGTPGSILTFFPWAGARLGRSGAGMVGETSFAVPEESLDFWSERLRTHGVTHRPESLRFGNRTLAFSDPDGLDLALVGESSANADAGDTVWPGVDSAFAIRGFHGVALLTAEPERTATVLTDIFGYEFEAEEDGIQRFRTSAAMAGVVELVKRSDRAIAGTGTTHHVAFRAKDEAQQIEWREELLDAGLHVTEVRDRSYFKSIYFREPNGVLFEIATDGPGFAIDESTERLGESLKLPPWLEAGRSEIQERLVELRVPDLQHRGETV